MPIRIEYVGAMWEMTLNILRRVDDYNQPFTSSLAAVYNRGAIGTLFAPTGPGRIEAISLIIEDVDRNRPLLNHIKILIDGVDLFSAGWEDCYYLFWAYGVATFGGVYASRETGADWTNVQRRIDLDYENSASVAFTNNVSPDPTTFVTSMWGRSGA